MLVPPISGSTARGQVERPSCSPPFAILPFPSSVQLELAGTISARCSPKPQTPNPKPQTPCPIPPASLSAGGDLDALGHLNNAAYLTLCEEARIDVLTTLFPAWWTKTYSPVVASASLQFKRPITAPGTVLVTVGFDPPGRSSLRMTYTIATEAEPGAICAEADSILVWVDLTTSTSIPIPNGLRDALAATTNGHGL